MFLVNKTRHENDIKKYKWFGKSNNGVSWDSIRGPSIKPYNFQCSWHWYTNKYQ